MSFQSGFSTQSALFRLPSRANKFQKSQTELIESAQAKVKSEKLLALERLHTFRDSLVKAIDTRINNYKAQLESEYNSFLQAYLEDMGQLASECEEYSKLEHPELDPTRPKVRFKEFEFFSKGSGKVLKKEKSQIVGYAENVELIEKKKKLQYGVELLEKRMLHVPGFAESEMARECMAEAIAKVEKFSQHDLDFLEGMVYKAEYVRLADVGVKVDKEVTDIKPSRKSIRMFKGIESVTSSQVKGDEGVDESEVITSKTAEMDSEILKSNDDTTGIDCNRDKENKLIDLQVKNGDQHFQTQNLPEQNIITTKPQKLQIEFKENENQIRLSQDFQINSENRESLEKTQRKSNTRDLQNYESSGGPKETHNIWEETIDRVSKMEGESKIKSTEQLLKREEMLNSMKDYEKTVEEYKKKNFQNYPAHQTNHSSNQSKSDQSGKNESRLSDENPAESDVALRTEETENANYDQNEPNSIQQNDRESLYTQVTRDSNNPPSLTPEQIEMIEKNRAKQELYMKKKAEMEFNDVKSTYDRMSVYSLKEEEQVGKEETEETAKQNLKKLENMFDLEGKSPEQIEKMMDQNDFRNSTAQETENAKKSHEKEEKTQNTDNQNNNKNNEKNKIENKQNQAENPVKITGLAPPPPIPDFNAPKPKTKPILNLKFRRTNIDIEKIVKGKKLNGLVHFDQNLFFFGDEFLFKCALNFKGPSIFKLKNKECTYLERYKPDPQKSDFYLLGVTNKREKCSEVLLFSLEKKFKVLSRVRVSDNERDTVMGVYSLTGMARFLVVTRFGKVHLCAVETAEQPHANDPTPKQSIILATKIISTEDLKGEFVESAIFAGKETSLSVVTQNNMIYTIELIKSPENGLAQKIQKTRFIQIEEAVNNIIKISEDQVGYCDEMGIFSLQTLPCALNNNKLSVRKTTVSEFPVDSLFLLKADQDPSVEYRKRVGRILMLNYEGRVSVFDFRKRKRQDFFDPKLVEDICYHSQNAILIRKEDEGKNEILILSHKTLRKLIIEEIKS